MPKNSKSKPNGAAFGIKVELFAAADKLRGHLDAARLAIEHDNPSLQNVSKKDITLNRMLYG